ncbi:MAG: molybdate ABC transporter substrate-binding protein [Opitutaceae bacterium]
MKRIWLLLFLIPFSAVAADKLSIAAAANLIYALESLKAEFKKTEPATNVTVVTGASGNLVAQIQNGAPFDVFLSADVEYPEKLVSLGMADARSFTKFAVGRLVLWSTRPQVDVSSVPRLVRDPKIQKIAVASMTTAPYGKAAREALTKLGLWQEAESKIVIGENITQAAQFVETGNADAGFVAMSLVLSPKLKDRGRWQEIDADLYSPLEQAAVITKKGESNPAAARFLRFLRGPEARAIFERFGYRLPEP